MSLQYLPFQMAHDAAARALWEATEGVGLSQADEAAQIESFLVRNPGLSMVALAHGKLVGTLLVGHDGHRGFIHHLAASARRWFDEAWRDLRVPASTNAISLSSPRTFQVALSGKRSVPNIATR